MQSNNLTTEMKQETIERAQRVLAMLNVIQYEIDALACDKAFFRHELKMAGKNFLRELEKQIKSLFDELDNDAELYYYSQIRCLEELLKAYAQNKVQVIEDEPDFEGWTCTDPDSFQYMRKIGIGIYEFSQKRKSSGGYVQEIINLNDYTEEQMWEHCSSFYERRQFDDFLAGNAELIAECIFESSNDLF